MGIKEALERYSKTKSLDDYPLHEDAISSRRVSDNVERWLKGRKMAQNLRIVDMVQELVGILDREYNNLTLSASLPITAEFSITIQWDPDIKSHLISKSMQIKFNPTFNVVEVGGKSFRRVSASAPKDVLEDALVWAYKNPARVRLQ